MADINKTSSIIVSHEGGYQCMKEDKGNYNSRGQLVGTKYGISALAYEKHFGKIPTSEDMANLTSDDFVIVLTEYWNMWKADLIENQSIADILVDWTYNSGSWGIKKPQEALGLKVDGKVGKNTIMAVNAPNREETFNKIWEAREEFINNICNKNPSQKKFYSGWMVRLNSFKFYIKRNG